jgi:hypothetical protein
LEDLPGNEELVKIKILTLCALFAECSCRTQESPPAFKDTRTRNFSLPAKGSICEGPQSNKLALIGLKPRGRPEQALARRRAEPSRPIRGEEASQVSLNLAPFNSGLSL